MRLGQEIQKVLRQEVISRSPTPRLTLRRRRAFARSLAAMVVAGALTLSAAEAMAEVVILPEPSTQPAGTWLDRLLGEGGLDGWIQKIRNQITEPLFWFGLGAQAMFFMRFFWQWIVSERRGHSTVPIAFWYFSLGGGIAMLIYAILRADLVIMLGQMMACVIYIRNLMLIYQQAAERRRLGLPRARLRSEVEGDHQTPETRP